MKMNIEMKKTKRGAIQGLMVRGLMGLITSAIAIHSAHADAELVRRVLQKSNQVERALDREAGRLAEHQLTSIDRLLTEILLTVTGTSPRPIPMPPLSSSFLVRAKIGNEEVVFENRERLGLYKECSEYLSGTMTRRITLEDGTEMKQEYPGWTNTRACALLALNASPSRANLRTEAIFQFTIGAKIFRVSSHSFDEKLQAIQELLPIYLENVMAREISVPMGAAENAVLKIAYPGIPGDRLLALILHAAAPKYGTWQVTGTLGVSGYPYYFAAQTLDQIEAECREYVKNIIAAESIRKVTANGREYTSSYPGMSITTACMNVKANASRR